MVANQGKCQEEKPDHHANHYHLSGFAGYTLDCKGKTGYKLGIEYEFRLSDYIGIGGSFDYTGANFEIFALGIGATFYPFQIPLVLGIGTGAKYGDTKWKSFSRTMAIYDFHLENISIGPMVMYDFFPDEKDIMSFGLTIGFGF